MFKILPVLVVVTLLSSGVQAEDHRKTRVVRTTRAPDVEILKVWQHLHQTRNTCPGTFDYWPKGGMRIFACHLFSLISYSDIIRLAGVEPFIKGPHQNGLSLNSRNNFGQYNPKFVKWATEVLVPGASDPLFRKATQPIYDKYIKSLARIYYLTYWKIRKNKACFEREKETYAGLLNKEALPLDFYERYFFFMNENFCNHPPSDFDWYMKHGFDAGVDGNVVKTAVAFWIRRSLDNTMHLWYQGLQRLVRTYDPDYKRKH